jgi:hypothetical protein
MDSSRRYMHGVFVGKPANRNSTPKKIIVKKIFKWVVFGAAVVGLVWLAIKL